MSALDPFAFLAAGARVQIECETERALPFVIDSTWQSGSRIWCHPAIEGDSLAFLAEQRVLDLYIVDPEGPLKVPIMRARATDSEIGFASANSVCFKVLPGTIRVQRRQYFRLKKPPILVGVRAPLIAEPATPFVQTQTHDLGAGGVSFVGDEVKLNIGDLVELLIGLPDATQIPAKGEILRSNVHSGDDPLIAIRFTQIRERDRDRIMAVIFREQTKRLRVGR